jgi:triacylglycerol lipase
LVHGIGLTHRRHFWGRIPAALQAAGADVHLGYTAAWGTVEHNAALLKQQLEQLLASTDAARINIIAHSKGGLDARCLAESLGCAPQIASITTLSTPHAGTKALDFVLRWFGWVITLIALPFNGLMHLWGERVSDFATVCAQLSTTAMQAFNRANLPAPEVYYQSYASGLSNLLSDVTFDFSYLLVKPFDGENDGLVSPASAPYGEFKGVLRSATRRGISHRDIIDLRMKPLGKRAVSGGVAEQGGRGAEGGKGAELAEQGDRTALCGELPLGPPSLIVTDIVDWHIALVADLKRRGF